MIRLFGALGPTAGKRRTRKEDVRYTRFDANRSRQSPQPADAEDRALLGAAVAEAHRPVSSIVHDPAPAVPVDENAHLYSEAHVSVAVLRNALPQRFADLR